MSATANGILNAIVSGLSATITGATVRRDLKPSMLTVDVAPCIAVNMGEYVSEWRGGGVHLVNADVEIYLVTRGDINNPSAALIDLAAAVELWLRANEKVGGVQWIGARVTYTPETDLQLESGLGLATMRVPIRFQTDHTAA